MIHWCSSWHSFSSLYTSEQFSRGIKVYFKTTDYDKGAEICSLYKHALAFCLAPDENSLNQPLYYFACYD